MDDLTDTLGCLLAPFHWLMEFIVDLEPSDVPASRRRTGPGQTWLSRVLYTGERAMEGIALVILALVVVLSTCVLVAYLAVT